VNNRASGQICVGRLPWCWAVLRDSSRSEKAFHNYLFTCKAQVINAGIQDLSHAKFLPIVGFETDTLHSGWGFSEKWEWFWKLYLGFHKNIKLHFQNRYRNNKCEYQISILEWFLKYHVTLKTGVRMLKIQLCHHGYKWHFKI